MQAALEPLKRFFIDDCLPVWADTSFGADGHFAEGLTLDGAREPTGVVRTRTAARQIYVFVHSSWLGVAPAGALEKAERAFERLHEVAWLDGDGPGCVRSFNRHTDTVIDPIRDLYDHACLLLALAWLKKATGKDSSGAHIDQTLAAIDTTLAASAGGWAEDNLHDQHLPSAPAAKR